MAGGPTDNETRIYTVSGLNFETRQVLSEHFPLIWVEGELSNFAMPASGHWYFTLKDTQAQVRCAMFRNRNRACRFKPASGMQVLVRARVGLYEPRGEFQLTIEHMEEAGAGALQRAFEALKQKLSAEGLFDAHRKRPIPAYPRCIGLITSLSGAALRDILSVKRRRLPCLATRIYPTAVQGDKAADEIVEALSTAARDAQCDILILARGGGSIEDLWPFNEERVARAIVACPIPVINAVGHEIDYTIADFAADLRAPTPSAAAELATPDGVALERGIRQQLERVRRRLIDGMKDRRQQLRWLSGRVQMQHPRNRIQRESQRIDDLRLRASHTLQANVALRRRTLMGMKLRLSQCGPRQVLQVTRSRHSALTQRLQTTVRARMFDRRIRLESVSRALRAVSPVATLDRGYALVYRHATQQLLRNPDEIDTGEQIDVRLAKGEIHARVLSKKGRMPS